LAAERAGFGWGDPGHWIPDLAVGWCLIGCGVIASVRYPESRSGVLMSATGFTLVPRKLRRSRRDHRGVGVRSCSLPAPRATAPPAAYVSGRLGTGVSHPRGDRRLLRRGGHHFCLAERSRHDPARRASAHCVRLRIRPDGRRGLQNAPDRAGGRSGPEPCARRESGRRPGRVARGLYWSKTLLSLLTWCFMPTAGTR
jgi:hypothetical protein